MDISSEYAKMCEAAEEVQAHYITIGDTAATKDGRISTVVPKVLGEEEDGSLYSKAALYFYDGPLRYEKVEDVTWLPRQDQLQEMIIADCAAELIESFYQWWEVYCQHHYSTMESMEQLWLMFVMHERKKFWDGFRWVADPKFEMFEKKEVTNAG